jgi:hypothetical protein
MFIAGFSDVQSVDVILQSKHKKVITIYVVQNVKVHAHRKNIYARKQ